MRKSRIIPWLLLSGVAMAAGEPTIPFIQPTDTVTGTDLAALGAALVHPDVPSNAAYDLARHPDPEAGRLLLAALPKVSASSSTPIVIPILQALGDRGDPAAANAVVAYLAHPDPAVAEVAGWAVLRLLRHQSRPRLKALERRPDRDRFGLMLREAEFLFAEEALRPGNRAVAERAFRPMTDRTQPTGVRLAGVRGLAASLGDRAASFLLALLADDDPAVRNASARLLESLPAGAADRALVAALPGSDAGTAILILPVLAARGAAVALPAVRQAAQAESEDVRNGAFAALGVLGSADDVPFLARIAAAPDGPDRTAARRALRELRSKDADSAILLRCSTAPPAETAELIRAAADRRTPGLVPVATARLADPDPGVRIASADALGVLGASPEYRALLGALAAAPAGWETEQGSIEKALIALANRLDDRPVTAPPALAALAGAREEIRPALLRLLAAIGGDDARRAVFKAVSTEATRDAAVRALAAWKDPSPAPDLLALVPLLPPGSLPVVALRGAIRLAGQDGDLSPDRRLALLDRAMALASRDEERKSVLSALGRIRLPEAWTRLEPFLTKPGFDAEAAGAAAKLAESLRASHPDIARSAASAALATSTSSEVKKAATKTLTALDATTGYLGAWVVSKAFELEGGTPEKLHAHAFPPETDPSLASWTPIEPTGEGKQPYALPLGDAVGGENRTAYLRTRVFAPKSRKAVLELGADDGVKAWLNGKEVVDDFALRALEPGQVKATLELKKGWNDLMLKITQGEGGWEACAKLRLPDGGPLPGLRSELP